jgi:transcriptional regulator with XRE-family HTH domain
METKPLRRTAIAAEVRAERARQGISLASLAAAIGKSPDTLTSRLLGKRPFHVEELLAICNLLGITLDELIARAVANNE